MDECVGLIYREYFNDCLESLKRLEISDHMANHYLVAIKTTSWIGHTYTYYLGAINE